MLVFTENNFVLLLKNTLLILAAERKSALGHRASLQSLSTSVSISTRVH